MKEITACFTGHRDIPQSELKQISKALKKAICEAYENGYRYFGSGAAVGFDLKAAETVLSLKRKYRDIKLILVIPCPEQTKYWSEKEIKRYEKIKSKADKTVCVSDHYFNGCMQKRNRFLVDNSSLCICYLTEKTGGTAYTVRYAQKEGLKIVNITDLICTVVNDRLHFSQKNMMKTILNKTLDVWRSRRRRETSKVGAGYITPI